MTPRAEAKDWFEFVGVDLGNATSERPSDSVGVAVHWQWPNALDGVTVADLVAVQRAIDGKNLRESVQANDWVGHTIGHVLGLDTEVKDEKAKVKALVKIWITSGALKVERAKDGKRMERPVVVVGRRADAPAIPEEA